MFPFPVISTWPDPKSRSLTFIESCIWTIFDTFIPALTVYHGTTGAAAEGICQGPGRVGSKNWLSAVWNVGGGNYAGNGKYVFLYAPTPELVGTSTYRYNHVYVDNVALRVIPTCFWPSDAVVTSVSTDEATISWTPDPRTANPSSWSIEYGETGFTPGEGSTETSYTTSVDLLNLTANTEYDVYIKANCGGEMSDATLFSFRTLCNALDSLPYSYGFEDLSTGSSSVRPEIPCWNHINNGSTYFGYPYVSSTTPHSGSRNLYWYGSTTTGTYSDYQAVVLPGIDTDAYAINTLQLKFWARPSSTSYSPVFQVGVMTSPNDISTFQLVSTVNVPSGSTSWDEYVVGFGDFTGHGQFVAVRLNRPASSYYVYTDDFTLLNHPAGGEVTSVALGADSLAGLASEDGTDLDLLDGEGVDQGGGVLADLLAGLDDELACQRVEDIVDRGTSENPLTEGLDDLILVLDSGGDKAPEGAAVLFRDDDVVRDIDKTAGEVTCVSGLKSGISQTLTCTVGGDEVLEHRHSLLKVGDDRVLNNLSSSGTGLLRLCHKASHTAELLDLLG